MQNTEQVQETYDVNLIPWMIVWVIAYLATVGGIFATCGSPCSYDTNPIYGYAEFGVLAVGLLLVVLYMVQEVR